ncbi:MAG: holo-ACP synthase [Gemmatimonadaceae bacterium]
MILGVGVDAIDIARIEHMFARYGTRMLERLFTRAELAYLSTKAFPAQHIAVRLAAKEAAYKALSGNDAARAIGWREVEVMSRSDGAPELRLHDRAAARFAELRGARVHVTLTHSQATAVAVVIVEGL